MLTRHNFLMISSLEFPTKLHRAAAEAVVEYFQNVSAVDTVLVVNSCARGQGVAESDLDLALSAVQGRVRSVVTQHIVTDNGLLRLHDA